MNKIELIQSRKDSSHLSKLAVEKIVTLFFDKMSDALAKPTLLRYLRIRRH